MKIRHEKDRLPDRLGEREGIGEVDALIEAGGQTVAATTDHMAAAAGHFVEEFIAVFDHSALRQSEIRVVRGYQPKVCDDRARRARITPMAIDAASPLGIMDRMTAQAAHRFIGHRRQAPAD